MFMDTEKVPLGGTTPIWGGLDGIKLRLDSPNW